MGRTEVATIRSPFSDEELAAVPALNPDVTIIHAQQADRKGNVGLWGISGVQKEAVLAARASLVTVEEIVDAARAPLAELGDAPVVGGALRSRSPRAVHIRHMPWDTAPATTPSTRRGTPSPGTVRRSGPGWKPTSWTPEGKGDDGRQRLLHRRDDDRHCRPVPAATGRSASSASGFPARRPISLVSPTRRTSFSSTSRAPSGPGLTCSHFPSVTANWRRKPMSWCRVPEIFGYWLQGGQGRRRIPVGCADRSFRKLEQHRHRALRPARRPAAGSGRSSGDRHQRWRGLRHVAAVHPELREDRRLHHLLRIRAKRRGATRRDRRRPEFRHNRSRGARARLR